MRRLLGLVLLTCAAVAAPSARAADVTRVASSAEPDNPFDLDVTVRYERTQRKAKITREFADRTADGGLGAVRDENELWYEQVTNRVVPRLAVGLYHDLELHAELPYVLGDNPSWKFTGDSERSIERNKLDPNGTPCSTDPNDPCTAPIFPVGTGQTVYHGGQLGDLTLGIAWGILSDKRDEYVPSWLVGIDVTAPTARRYDPFAGRVGPDFASPFTSSSKQAPVGHKVWLYDLQTAISKRMGPVDPYLRAHARLAQKSSQTYSNCEHAGDPAAAGAFTSVAGANCALPTWKDDAAAKPPHVFGLEFGSELVPYEDRVEHQRFAIDLRLSAEYTTQARWYNELTDATGKLMWTDPYVSFKALVGLSLRASSYIQLRAAASLAHDFTHLVSGEPLGKKPADTLAAADVNGPAQNPNFDWRYDAPGRRFRVSETSVFDLTVSAVVNF
jgi:hypothetical protein